MQDSRYRLALIVLIVGFFVWKLYPPQEKVTLGLDLQGGMHVVLQVDIDKAVEFEIDRMQNDVNSLLESKDIPITRVLRQGISDFVIEFSNSEWRFKATQIIKKSNPELKIVSESGKTLVLGLKDEHKLQIQRRAHSQSVQVIRNRIDKFGVAEPSIQEQGTDRIVVQLPGVKDLARAQSLLKKTAVLELRLVSDDQDKLLEALKGDAPPGYEVLYMIRYVGGDETKIPYLVKKRPEVTGNHLEDARVSFDQMGQPTVSFSLDRVGSKIFAKVTEQHQGRGLAIVLDNEVQSAPIIRSIIPNGKGVIEGNFTPNEAKDLAIVLTSGALPAPVKIIMDARVGPTLGSDSVKQGVRANLVGFGLVVVFMIAYYFMGGVFAVLALIMNLVIVFGSLAALHASLTLPGIAGIILTIGMAVDANVLIFERIREEQDAGKKVRAAIDAGYSKATSTIVDANLTTLITALFLYQFGTGPVRGFAVTLSIGIFASMFTSLFVTRTFFKLLCLNQNFNKVKMLRFFSRSSINFVKLRYYAYILSLLVIVAGGIQFGLRGKSNFGVDFTGGDLIEMRFSEAVPLEDIREKLSKIGLEKATIQQFGDPKEVIVRAGFEEAIDVVSFLNDEYLDIDIEERRREAIGPTIGQEFRRKGLLALCFSLFGILIYVTWRFDFEYALGAILALIHDLLIPISLIVFTGRELSLNTIAALLTIIGYSINDSIVVCDRIRENLKIMKKMSIGEIINLSLNQTLSRTLLTSLTTLLVVLALFFFGGAVIHDFAFVLLVGVLSGTYSTIFIAIPVIMEFQRRKKVPASHKISAKNKKK